MWGTVSRYRSPSHQYKGGSLAEIFVRRSATRWLRLYGYVALLMDIPSLDELRLLIAGFVKSLTRD